MSTSAGFELLTALSMTVGRGRAARAIADSAGLGAAERVVDVGCGPGTALRHAARRGALAIGVDPAPAMLRLGRRITALQRIRTVSFARGAAEALPVPDRNATVVWALSSVHHWSDRLAGLSESRRVLVPGGRILLMERLVKPGARGHAAHGLTRDQAAELARDLHTAGFTDIREESRTMGRRTFVIVRGRRPEAG